ncbi:MAG: hypothetical protein JJE42_11425 [Burkholderiales bacterium]|nr:hypothetical protein [Burkholderiales bacterium]
MVLHLAFIDFHRAIRFRVNLDLDPDIFFICIFARSVHEFHIGHQPDPKTSGWRDIGPGPAQRLPYGHASDQPYATKHIRSFLTVSLIEGIQLPGRIR